MLPAPVRQFSVLFDPLDALDAADWIQSAPMPNLGDATPMRRFEFLAGRVCDAEAMRRIRPGYTSVLGRHSDGAPLWPAGFTGSITRSIGFVSAAVAPIHIASAVGIDSEEILSAERAARIASVFATGTEIAVARAAGLDQQAAVTLIFSAKEAVFKCLHASIRGIFDFHGVRITGVSPDRRRFTAHVLQELDAVFRAGSTFSGRFEVDSRRVHRGVSLRPQACE